MRSEGSNRMTEEIKWLFFDLGSTLIDETECYRDRVMTMISGTDVTYDEFTDNECAMDAFGRSWDNADMDSIKLILESLVQAYGKKNVVAMMNTIKGDAEGWKSFSNGRIDNAISNYGKALDSLLK